VSGSAATERHAAAPVTRESRDVLSLLPWMLIPYDSLTHLVGLSQGSTAETLPATAVFSLFYLGVRARELRVCAGSRTVFLRFAQAAALMAVMTLLNIALEQSGQAAADLPDLRMVTAVRQAVSMALGLTTFLMFQDALLRRHFGECMRWVVLGAIPSMVAIGLQIAAGNFRVQGFSPEPSELADMLVFAFLPACVYAFRETQFRLASGLTGIVALFRAFSGTGLIEIFFVTGSYFVARRKFVWGAVLLGLLGIGVFVTFKWFPQNYVVAVISYMTVVYNHTGDLVTGSFIDRFYGLVGPLMMMGTPHAWLGFGFGGDTVYFYHLFSMATASVISGEKQGFVSISSLQGKMLMYGGVLGYGYYLSGWAQAWRRAPRGSLPRIMLLGVFATSLFSLGPMFMPYTWLWLAVTSTSQTRLESSRLPPR
jgi:hypothetical protein